MGLQKVMIIRSTRSTAKKGITLRTVSSKRDPEMLQGTHPGGAHGLRVQPSHQFAGGADGIFAPAFQGVAGPEEMMVVRHVGQRVSALRLATGLVLVVGFDGSSARAVVDVVRRLQDELDAQRARDPDALEALHASVGLASYPLDGDTSRALILAAHERLETAIDRGPDALVWR